VDVERGASGSNVGAQRSCRQGSSLERLFVGVGVVAVEDFVVAVAGKVACAGKQCSEGLHGKEKKGEGEKPEQPRVVLQGGIVTGTRA
jgi:hypothetical protein